MATRRALRILRAPRALLLCFLLGFLFVCAWPTPAQAEPGASCTPGAPCLVGYAVGWRPHRVVLPITPAAGGHLVDRTTGFELLVPSRAVSKPAALTYESATTPPQLVPPPGIALGYFTLRAQDSVSGEPVGFAQPWQAAIAFAVCGPGCPMAFVDEASLRCEHLDEASGAWVRLERRAVDVFGNRLYCGDAQTGQFAVVGDPAAVSGITDRQPTFLPLARR